MNAVQNQDTLETLTASSEPRSPKAVILLGAGASMDAGRPNAVWMTKEVLNHFARLAKDVRKHEIESAILSYIVCNIYKEYIYQHHLNFYEINVNVEDLFNTLITLSEKERIDISSTVNYKDEKLFFLEQEWWKHHKENSGDPYNSIRKKMIAFLKEKLWVDFGDDKTDYISPLVTLADTKKIPIFTLNYDNVIENACHKNNIVCNRFIKDWQPGQRFATSSSGIEYYKIHGSIDWHYQSQSFAPSPHGGRINHPVQEISKPLITRFDPLIIFGQRNKLTAEGPFLDLLRQFSDALLSPTNIVRKVIVIGYSFSDPHINIYLKEWLENNPRDNQLVIIDPGFKTMRVEFARHLQTLTKSKSFHITPILEKTGKALLDNEILKQLEKDT